MKNLWKILVLAGLLMTNVFAADKETDEQPQAPGETRTAKDPVSTPQTVGQAYPNLASAILVHAQPKKLPEGVLVRAGDVTVTQKDINAELEKAPASIRDQLQKNAFFLLEQIATRKLLLREARKSAAGADKDASKISEKELLKSYFDTFTAEVNVSNDDVAAFYAENKDMVGGQPLEAVKDNIVQFLRQQKRQEVLDEHIRTLGRKKTIDVASSWLKRQAEQAMDNPVDKARASNKPTLVDFGSKGCRPCDMLQPVLANLRRKYEGRANILFVSVRERQILASRFGVQSIPTLIFFNEDGREAFRHTGFLAQEKLEKKLIEIGVKEAP